MESGGPLPPEFPLNDLPILDPRPLQDLLDLGVGAGLVRELTDLLSEDGPQRIEALRRGLAAGDEERVAQEAHQLKGALGNLGLSRFAEGARLVEVLAREGRLAEAGVLVEGFPAALAEALSALGTAFPEAP